SATQTATAAAVAADEGAAGQEGEKAAEKIGDVPAAPSPRPSPSPSVVSSPSPRATPAPTTEAEPPMRLARPVRTADRPVVVDVIEPEDVPREDRAPARVIPGGAGGAARQPSAPSRTPFPRSSGAATGGWGSPALVEDFGGEALRLGEGGQEADLSAASVQRYGRWEVRLRAEDGALPVALLRSAGSGAPEYGDARYAEYTGSRYEEFPQPDGAGAEDAEIGVTAIGDADGRRAQFSVRQGRERARAEMAADFTQWHTITVDWLPGRVTFWLDGRQVWNYTGPHVPRSEGMGLVLRNGASGGGPVTGTVYVDWVRIYRAPGR
ncbi:glycoside hydrolase family 16 protein, partial [Microbispora sp. NPDC049633]|uniref:glycoside hydrolase family 16 protein n=1 Tax=Microbispora sp. NPDC049633 TaxID=3154355 RepID=UPI0034235CA2